jgi:protein-tyrosine phosphatase
MGAALLQHALAAQPEPLKSLRVISAGLAARGDNMVSENSVFALKRVGIDISGFRSQPLTQQLLDDALVVFCMTETHRAMIQLQGDPPPTDLYLFREFLPPGVDKEIPDPYGGPLKLYEQCRDEMVEAIPSLIEFLQRLTTQTT